MAGIHEGIEMPFNVDGNTSVATSTPNSPIEDKHFDCDPVPLCVDLDGTLIRTDVLVEGMVGLLVNRNVLRWVPQILVGGRARLKQRVAEHSRIDVSTLPYNREFLDYLETQRSLGRTLVLATAADARIAHAVAEHLKIFDEVLCSDGVRNLKGSAKAAALVDRFGRGAFDYAGNDYSDLPVWKEARVALLVNGSSKLRSRIVAPSVDLTFSRQAPRVRSAIKAMRPHQWLKNLLVFVPIIMAHAVTHTAELLQAVIIFLSFCATASSIYLINDVADLSADRRHPRKRNRVLASGKISLVTGLILAFLLGILGLSLATSVGCAIVVLIYAAVSISYSLRLKEFPILDVFVLAGLYTIRMLGGGVATGHDVSMWLLAFSGFLFLSLALVKRTGEMDAVARSAGSRVAARRGYFSGDLPVLTSFGCASSFASAVVLALFVRSDSALLHYATPEFLWGIIPLMLFWQCRLWLSTVRGHMHDDPIVYAARDWVSWIVVFCIAVVALAATMGVPLSVVGIAA
jgi:4-hydroxybenzoate polyprenyltransferase